MSCALVPRGAAGTLQLPVRGSYMLNLEDITLKAVEDVGMDFWW